MSMIGRRKPREMLSRTGEYIRKREDAGLPLPPSMRRGSKEYIKSAYWQTLKQRTLNSKEFTDSKRNASYKRNCVSLDISKEEFDSWVDDNWSKFEALYAEGKIPSIDRIDNNGNYCRSNMDVIDLKENMAKDRRIPVVAVCVESGVVLRFASAKDAHRNSLKDDSMPNFCDKGISRAIKRGGTHMGYKWSRE